MFKLRLLVTLCFIQSCLWLSSCATTAGKNERPEDFTNAQSIFWEVSKDDQKHFLMGTLHVGVNLVDLPQEVLAHLGSSESFIGELNSFEIDQSIMQRYTFLPRGETLSAKIGKDYVAKFKAMLDEKEFPYQPQIIERLSLYSVYSTLLALAAQGTEASEEKMQEESPNEKKDDDQDVHPLVQQIDQASMPIDLKLAALAGNQGLEIRGFESLEDQLLMFQKFCTADKIKTIIDHKNEAKELIQGLSSAYQNSSKKQAQDSQEQDAFANFMVTMLQSMSAEDRRILLHERNHRWMKIFESLTAGRSSFIAVGAGHIPGEDGLVTLLRKAGYQVRPAFLQVKEQTANL
ncbi:MAG: TraB/GumN family protein [Oligoflexus sp.]